MKLHCPFCRGQVVCMKMTGDIYRIVTICTKCHKPIKVMIKVPATTKTK